jgi:hypothetical protein
LQKRERSCKLRKWHNVTGKERLSLDLGIPTAFLEGHIEQIKQRRDAATQKLLLQREH